MAIGLAERVKHEVAKGIVRSVLKEAGYRVISLGMENVLREVAPLTDAEYKTLNLPKVVRTLPDFIVFQKDMTARHLVEVKYRSDIDQKLIDNLPWQVEAVGEMTLVLLHGRSSGVGTLKDLNEIVRCGELEKTNQGTFLTVRTIGQPPLRKRLDRIAPKDFWGKLAPLSTVFSLVKPVEAAIEAAIESSARALAI